MSENLYDEDLGSTKVTEENEEENKKKWVIPAAVVSIIALILGLLFFFNREEDTVEPPVEETTTSVEEQEGQESTNAGVPVETGTMTPGTEVEETEQPETETDEPGFVGNAEPRVQPEPETPLPTTGNQAAIDSHAAPFDVKSGLPSEISRFSVTQMFTMAPKAGMGYKEHFDQNMQGFLSPQMKRTGFKPWWGADEPEHTSYFHSLSLTPGTKIYNQVEPKSERRTANDMIEYHYVVKPRVRTEQGFTNLADFEIVVEMVGNEKDGTWLMNDYYFPEGRVPPLH